jgi:hypothetical protein
MTAALPIRLYRSLAHGAWILLASCLVVAAGTVFCAPVEQTTGWPTSSHVALEPPPRILVSKLNLSPFYQKYLQLGNFPLLASKNVPDEAIWTAREIVAGMLTNRPDLIHTLGSAHIRLAVMGRNEVTVDIPEHSDLEPAAFWNQRARGLGPTSSRPAISCAEENLLQQPDDRYKGESICVHEFAHAIQLALGRSSDSFMAALQTHYWAAKRAGLWKNTYAAENLGEYWAEGVQSYFDANQSRNFNHNGVRTREQLAAYDPALFGLINETLAAPAWRLRYRRAR